MCLDVTIRIFISRHTFIVNPTSNSIKQLYFFENSCQYYFQNKKTLKTEV